MLVELGKLGLAEVPDGEAAPRPTFKRVSVELVAWLVVGLFVSLDKSSEGQE